MRNRLFGVIAFAIGLSNANSGPLEDAVSRYRNAKLVTMNVTKTVKSKVLNKEDKFIGKIFLSQSKFRWDTEEPEKSQIIYDGKTIWNIQHPSKELPGPLQVAKSKVDKNSKKQIVLATLLGTGAVKKHFKVVRSQKGNPETVFYLESKDSDMQIKDLSITVDKKRITSISYKDDIGNLTLMNFNQIEFASAPKSKLFKYSPPKDAQVISL